ncbi:MAG: UDP-N-acetylmuramoyl-tripeptide--D-alanyl-D-alanine ligase [Bacteroidales bacterium]|nr:UDP-N-acetylmuramoyl-tripeptide--D-alanyl-D-alanine ligase [Bacteroidales bacterium]
MNYDTLYLVIAIIGLVAAAVDFDRVARRELMMFQQNSYRPERYCRWWKTAGESTNPGRLGALIALLLLLVRNIDFVMGAAIAIVILVTQAYSLTVKKYKKPLVMTRRAARIYSVMWVLALGASCGVGLGVMSLKWGLVTAVACVVLSPALLFIAYFLLKPVEAHINKKYYNEAARMLGSMPDLKIIGVTGSYGKTSTKHYLQRILSEQFDTLMTPGSFNTTLGVIRTVREQLKPYNEVFIVEMGAKQPGEIKEICDLVHPSIGIVTAVGEQHLESFKTIENVQKTKFELVDALPADGLAVVNDDFPYAACRKVDNTRCKRYAVRATDNAQFTAKDIQYSTHGTTFTIVGPDGKELTLTTRLVGECNISNLMAAVIVALELGVPEQKIRYAVEKIEQVEHRLNLKRTPGGIAIIDDAFNSNPTGSRMALDVLAAMTGGKRIVITPGMIELGDRQEELNRDLGAYIHGRADVAIIVGHYNREALLAGLELSGMESDNVYAVDSFNEAQRVLQSIARPGDTVLYENDLPDTFK